MFKKIFITAFTLIAALTTAAFAFVAKDAQVLSDIYIRTEQRQLRLSQAIAQFYCQANITQSCTTLANEKTALQKQLASENDPFKKAALYHSIQQKEKQQKPLPPAIASFLSRPLPEKDDVAIATLLTQQREVYQHLVEQGMIPPAQELALLVADLDKITHRIDATR